MVLLGETRDLAVRTLWGRDCRSWDLDSPSESRKGMVTSEYSISAKSLSLGERAPDGQLGRVQNSSSWLSAGREVFTAVVSFLQALIRQLCSLSSLPLGSFTALSHSKCLYSNFLPCLLPFRLSPSIS